MNHTLKVTLNRLARGCRILEMEGHGDMTLGHLSLRDPEGRGFWLKRNARGLGEILSYRDFVLVALETIDDLSCLHAIPRRRERSVRVPENALPLDAGC